MPYSTTQIAPAGDAHLAAARREYVVTVARNIVDQVIPANPLGFTYDPRGMYLPTFHPDVYIVSLYGYTWTGQTAPSHTALTTWILAHLQVLDRPCHYIGGWLSVREGLYHLDVSIPVRTELAALRVAADERQSVIYHPASGREINVPQTLPAPHRRVA